MVIILYHIGRHLHNNKVLVSVSVSSLSSIEIVRFFVDVISMILLFTTELYVPWLCNVILTLVHLILWHIIFFILC